MNDMERLQKHMDDYKQTANTLDKMLSSFLNSQDGEPEQNPPAQAQEQDKQNL